MRRVCAATIRMLRSPRATPGWRREKGSNLLLFGPPGSGKTHASAALAPRSLIENGYRVLFLRTTELVQRLQAARQALQLEAALGKPDKYDLLILDDLCYSPRIRPRPACCSSSSALATSAVPC